MVIKLLVLKDETGSYSRKDGTKVSFRRVSGIEDGADGVTEPIVVSVTEMVGSGVPQAGPACKLRAVVPVRIDGWRAWSGEVEFTGRVLDK